MVDSEAISVRQNVEQGAIHADSISSVILSLLQTTSLSGVNVLPDQLLHGGILSYKLPEDGLQLCE